MNAAPLNWLLAHWRWLALCVALAALALLGLGQGQPPPGKAQAQAPPAERYRDLDSPLEEVRALATRLAEADARIVALEGAASAETVPARSVLSAPPSPPPPPASPPAPNGQASTPAAEPPSPRASVAQVPGPVAPVGPQPQGQRQGAPAWASGISQGEGCPPPCRGEEDLPLLPAALHPGEEASISTQSIGSGGGQGWQGVAAESAQAAAYDTLEAIPEAAAVQASVQAPGPYPDGLQWVGGGPETGGGPEAGGRVLAPAGATLLDARLLTALIGRVPRNGTLVDPLPFKAVVGARNYFAPGVRLPGLRGALLRGETVGDLLLSCTRARITSISWRDGRGRWRQHSAQGGLGYLSDRRGSPCISGRLFTSLRSAAIWAALSGGLTSASEAWVAARTAQSGLAGQLLAPPLADLGRAGLVQGGSEALSDWVGERLDDTFDAVIVPAGSHLVAHLEVPIPQDGR